MHPAWVAIIIALLPSVALAHGGGLNAEGCHNDRKGGGYHCHRGTHGADRPAASRLLGSSVSYANCSAVRAAGAAPIRIGEPGYSGRLDRDGDGVACE